MRRLTKEYGGQDKQMAFFNEAANSPTGGAGGGENSAAMRRNKVLL